MIIPIQSQLEQVDAAWLVLLKCGGVLCCIILLDESTITKILYTDLRVYIWAVYMMFVVKLININGCISAVEQSHLSLQSNYLSPKHI